MKWRETDYVSRQMDAVHSLPCDDAVRVSKLCCCHDDATGKVGQRALATPRLSWQHGRSIKPERCDDSHARARRTHALSVQKLW